MSRYRIFKPLKKEVVNNKKIFGFDTETYHIKRDGYVEQKFYLGSIVGENFKKISKDKHNFAEFLATSRALNRSIIMASNLEFDLFHTFEGTPYMNQLHLIDHHGIIYGKIGNKNHNRVFLDTNNYMKASVEKLGKMLNMPKLDKPSFITEEFWRKPKNKKEELELMTYNLRDSTISREFGVFMQDFCNRMNCKLKITIASIGLDLWRRNYMPKAIFQEREHYIKKHFQGSFHGGRTELFKRGLIKDAHYYDFNSHYPACCLEGVDGKGSYPLSSSCYYIENSNINYVLDYEGISEVTVFAPDSYIMLLGIYTPEGKYIFPKGLLNGWFTHIELREAIKRGYQILKVHQSLYYTDLFVPFKNAVKDLFLKRKHYKKDDNKPMEQMIKLIMNAGLFGKFAQKIDGIQHVITSDKTSVDDKGRLFIKSNGKKIEVKNYLSRGEFIVYTRDGDKIPIYSNPILSSYTTSLARLKLYRYMKSKEEHVVYCDTDSIVSKKKCFSSSKDLGDLDYEHYIEEGIFIRPKLYYIFDGEKEYIRSKGFPRLKNKDQFMSLVNDKFMKLNKFLKWKESYVRKMPYSSIITFFKHINMEDNKRLWFSDFSVNSEQDSIPIVV